MTLQRRNSAFTVNITTQGIGDTFWHSAPGGFSSGEIPDRFALLSPTKKKVDDSTQRKRPVRTDEKENVLNPAPPNGQALDKELPFEFVERV
jgi:hypothetical protein